MSEFLKKLVPKNIAGILGLIQTAIPVIRELLIVITRICAIVIPGDKDDKIIAKISAGFKTFEAILPAFANSDNSVLVQFKIFFPQRGQL